MSMKVKHKGEKASIFLEQKTGYSFSEKNQKLYRLKILIENENSSWKFKLSAAN